MIKNTWELICPNLLGSYIFLLRRNVFFAVIEMMSVNPFLSTLKLKGIFQVALFTKSDHLYSNLVVVELHMSLVFCKMQNTKTSTIMTSCKTPRP